MKELTTEIEINSTPDHVWKILTDFATFPEWNPFIRRARGELRPGGRLEVLLGASGTQARIFRPTVLAVEPNRELRWLGKLFLGGLFDGEHIFSIEPLEDQRVRLVQRERFSGLLIPFMNKLIDVDTRRGFEEMNQALKQRAEQFGPVG